MKVFDKYKPTHVIHLAALVGGLFANMAYKLTFLRDNCLINDNVLWAAKEHKVIRVDSQRWIKSADEKVVAVRKGCVVPFDVRVSGQGQLPDRRDCGSPRTTSLLKLWLRPRQAPRRCLQPVRLRPFFACRVQKRPWLTHSFRASAYHEQYGCNFTAAIPTNIFGEGDNFDLDQAHVIPALIHRCYLAKSKRLHPGTTSADPHPSSPENGTPFVVSGTGKPLRQFIYNQDLAKLFIWQLREYPEIDPIILSGKSDSTLANRKRADDQPVQLARRMKSRSSR